MQVYLEWQGTAESGKNLPGYDGKVRSEAAKILLDGSVVWWLFNRFVSKILGFQSARKGEMIRNLNVFKSTFCRVSTRPNEKFEC